MTNSKVWVVLIGIDFYPEPVNRLRGAVNDVNEIERTLSESYQDIEITKLISAASGDLDQSSPSGPTIEWPTYENIVAAFNQVLQNASSGDTVYIHYSGHGTLRPTAGSTFEYREHYGTDAALVLIDPQAKHGERYLRGAELALLLDDIVKSGVKLMVSLDACHSGSISRNEYNAVRSMPWKAAVDAEFPFQPSSFSSASESKSQILRDATSMSHWLLHPRGYTLIAACGPHEIAKEISLSSGQYHGAMSYYMLEALDFCAMQQVGEITSDLVYRRICARMYIRFTSQHPILLGNQPIVSRSQKTAVKRTSGTCEIIQIMDDVRVLLNAGHIQGVRIGDEYEIFSFEGSGDPVSRAIVTNVQAIDSVAERVRSKTAQDNDSPIRVGYSAALASMTQARAYIKLHPNADKAWDAMLKKSIWLQKLDREETSPIDLPCFSIDDSTVDQYMILDVNRQQISNVPAFQASSLRVKENVLNWLEHLAKFSFVENLRNNQANALLESDFGIQVQVKGGSAITPTEDYIQVEDGSKISVTFRNKTRGVLHFTVFDLLPHKQIKKLYPPQKEYQTVLPQDSSEVLPKTVPGDVKPPGRIRFAAQMTIPQRILDGPSAQADEILKIIISTSPMRGTLSLELPDLWAQADTVTRSSDTRFGSFIQDSFTNNEGGPSLLRGEEALIKWTCHSVMIRTVPKPG